MVPPAISSDFASGRRSVPLNGASPATVRRESNDLTVALPTSGGHAIQVLVCNRLHANLRDPHGQASAALFRFRRTSGCSGSLQVAMNISDLARQLNVSTATVSRALSRPEKVAPATRKRILEFVRRSGYHMNGIARSLRTQSTRTIGVIVSDIRNPVFFGHRQIRGGCRQIQRVHRPDL